VLFTLFSELLQLSISVIVLTLLYVLSVYQTVITQEKQKSEKDFTGF